MSLGHGASVVRDGLVLHLDAANPKSYPGSGTTWFDLSGNGNNGTLVNGVGYSSDNSGTLTLTGTTDYVVNSSTTNLPVSNSNRTISIWCKPFNNNNTFVQIGTGGSGTGVQAYIVQFYGLYIYTDGINGSNNITVPTENLPVLNVWNNFVFLNEGQNWKYYLNGELKNSGTWSVTLNTIGQQYSVGRRMDLEYYANANFSSVSIYNRALSASEIQQNFEALRGRYGI